MTHLWDVSRRAFLKVTGLSLILHPATAARLAGAGMTEAPARGFEVLTQSQVATLEAIAAQLIPKDDDPGAREALAVRYIDRVLAGQQRDRGPLYVAGLASIDRTSIAMFKRRFTALDFESQTRVLQAIDQGEVGRRHWPTIGSQEFFQLVWMHTLEGFYGSPEYGGNAEHASWKMVGYPLHR